MSNLSQAIRFLVANDFLENVELKPGQAENPLISVIHKDESQGGSGSDAKGTQCSPDAIATDLDPATTTMNQ